MVEQISVPALAQMLSAGAKVFLLDVRQPWESQLASLPGSVLIPLGELPARHSELEVHRDTALVVYCHHGIRSLSAAAFLQRLGYQHVQSLHGGIDAWSCTVDPSIARY